MNLVQFLLIRYVSVFGINSDKKGKNITNWWEFGEKTFSTLFLHKFYPLVGRKKTVKRFCEVKRKDKVLYDFMQVEFYPFAFSAL